MKNEERVIPQITDKQIKDETDALLKECILHVFQEFGNLKIGLTEEDLRSIAMTRFIYLKDKVLDHPPKYIRKSMGRATGEVEVHHGA